MNYQTFRKQWRKTNEVELKAKLTEFHLVGAVFERHFYRAFDELNL